MTATTRPSIHFERFPGVIDQSLTGGIPDRGGIEVHPEEVGLAGVDDYDVNNIASHLR